MAMQRRTLNWAEAAIAMLAALLLVDVLPAAAEEAPVCKKRDKLLGEGNSDSTDDSCEREVDIP